MISKGWEMELISKFRFTRGKRAITLFEMIVVLTVTLILSLIFIFSTKQLVIKTKTERVKEEHRVLSRAIQNYRMDYNEYPMELYSLSAPTAYLSSIPNDPFLSKYPNKTYIYFKQPADKFQFIIISVGPDGDFDMDDLIRDYQQLAGTSDEDSDEEDSRDELMETLLPLYLISKTYDPTNGAVSDGDIITFVQR